MKRMLMIIGMCLTLVAFATAGFAADAAKPAAKTEDVKKADDVKKVKKVKKTKKAKKAKKVAPVEDATKKSN